MSYDIHMNHSLSLLLSIDRLTSGNVYSYTRTLAFLLALRRTILRTPQQCVLEDGEATSRPGIHAKLGYHSMRTLLSD